MNININRKAKCWHRFGGIRKYTIIDCEITERGIDVGSSILGEADFNKYFFLLPYFSVGDKLLCVKTTYADKCFFNKIAVVLIVGDIYSKLGSYGMTFEMENSDIYRNYIPLENEVIITEDK